jgi:carboxylesterase
VPDPVPPHPVLPGAEPYHASGGTAGVLVLHGFTGTPQSMRGLAEAFAAAGFTVELPLLPGHGTSPEDLAETGWDDWARAAEEALTDLRGRCGTVAVVGLSVGGALALHLAQEHPDLAGIVVINPGIGTIPEEIVAQLRGALDAGVPFIPAVGGDVADPDASELAYDRVPIASSLSLVPAVTRLREGLSGIRCPVLLITSADDHVVDAASKELVATEVSGPVEVLRLTRSYHVATVDYDRAEVEQRAVEFVRGLVPAGGVAAEEVPAG